MKTMKSIYKIYFFFIILLSPAFLNAQTAVVDLAKVQIDSVRFTADWKTVEFNLSIIKTDDVWDYWADGTVQIGFNDSIYQISNQNTFFSIVDDSTCEIGNILINPLTGGKDLKDSVYIMTWEVLDGRISITIGGPKYYDLCQVFGAKPDKKRLGRFRISTNEQRLPIKLKFLTGDDLEHPYFFYQSLAYKSDKEVDIGGILGYHRTNDNVEMDNGINTEVIYNIDDKMPAMVIDTFWAEYAGNFKVLLRFITSSEPLHKGFILERFLYPFGEKVDFNSIPWGDHQVGAWSTGREVDTCLIGNPTHVDGYSYFYHYDIVPQREETYYYRLLYTDLQDSVIYLDTCHLQIPQVIIYEVSAQPNPFGNSNDNKTTITFRLEEEAWVTCKVYDLEGKLVETLADNVKLPQGNNQLEFRAKPFSQQGLYDVLILATPTIDMPIDIGRTVYKIQYIR
jgi:hypothetical protein